MKKYFVLITLFVLPLTVYLIFSKGVNNFAKLPVLTEDVKELSAFHGEKNILLKDNITVLGFLGNDVKNKFANIFNLTHKIYKPYYEFNDLQFVMVVQEGNEPLISEMMEELDKITDTKKWNFIYGSPEEITALYTSLKTGGSLDNNKSTPYVYIIDKDRKLRGRTDDKDISTGLLYGYNTSVVAELSSKMKDDIKVILAEYRLELKKNNQYKRKI